MKPRDIDFDKRLAHLERHRAGAAKLATVASLAARIEAALLRALRLRLLPGVSADAEADVWFSGLVQSYSPLGIVLYPQAATTLRERLKREASGAVPAAPGIAPAEARTPLLDRAWEVISEVHRNAPPAVRLEERVTYISLLDDPKAAQTKIEQLLLPALARVSEGHHGLARWARGALARLPQAARETRAAALLDAAAAAELRGTSVLPPRPLSGGKALPWTPPRDQGSVDVFARKLHRRVELSFRPSPGAVAVPVPDAPIALLEIAWQQDGREVVVPISVRRDAPEPAAREVGADELWLRTATGRTFHFGPAPSSNVASPAPRPLAAHATLRIIHLSNLLFRADAGADAAALDALPEAAAEWRSRLTKDGSEGADDPGAARGTVVVLAGDVTSTGSPREFAAARQWLTNKFLPAACGAGSGAVVVAVPGNHDVRGELSERDERAAVEAIVDGGVDAATAWLASRAGGNARQRLQPFFDFAGGFAPFEDLLCGAAVVPLGTAASAGFARLVTPILARPRDSARANAPPLRVGAAQLGLTLAPLAAADLRVAVMHHSPSRLATDDGQRVLDALEQADVRLLLHGHVGHPGPMAEVRHGRSGRPILLLGTAWREPNGHAQQTAHLIEVRWPQQNVRVETRSWGGRRWDRDEESVAWDLSDSSAGATSSPLLSHASTATTAVANQGPELAEAAAETAQPSQPASAGAAAAGWIFLAGIESVSPEAARSRGQLTAALADAHYGLVLLQEPGSPLGSAQRLGQLLDLAAAGRGPAWAARRVRWVEAPLTSWHNARSFDSIPRELRRAVEQCDVVLHLDQRREPLDSLVVAAADALQRAWVPIHPPARSNVSSAAVPNALDERGIARLVEDIPRLLHIAQDATRHSPPATAIPKAEDVARLNSHAQLLLETRCAARALGLTRCGDEAPAIEEAAGWLNVVLINAVRASETRSWAAMTDSDAADRAFAVAQLVAAQDRPPVALPGSRSNSRAQLFEELLKCAAAVAINCRAAVETSKPEPARVLHTVTTLYHVLTDATYGRLAPRGFSAAFADAYAADLLILWQGQLREHIRLPVDQILWPFGEPAGWANPGTFRLTREPKEPPLVQDRGGEGGFQPGPSVRAAPTPTRSNRAGSQRAARHPSRKSSSRLAASRSSKKARTQLRKKKK